MMINLENVMDEKMKKNIYKNELSLKLIFFDGEEEFEKWGKKE
jgi:hypothetical protein